MPKLIQDKFSAIPNKEARFYFRKREAGLCVFCGGPRTSKWLSCDSCRAKRAAANKLRYQKRERKPTTRPSKYATFITI